MSYSSVKCFWHNRIFYFLGIIKVFSGAIQHPKFEHRLPEGYSKMGNSNDVSD